MTPADLVALRTPTILQALRQHTGDDPNDFALHAPRDRGWPITAMAEQVGCRRRAARKLPGWNERDCLYLPRALEQCASLPCARHKNALLDDAGVLDCCAGLGVDASLLADAGRPVLACEHDPLLAELLAYNAERLGITLTIHAGDGLAALRASDAKRYPQVYADPDRREGGRRRLALSDLRPEPTAVLGAAGPRRVLLRLPPGSAPQELRALPGLRTLHYVSHAGELKELLADCPGADEAAIGRRALRIDDHGRPTHEITTRDGGDAGANLRDEADAWFFEPDPAVIRAGLVGALAARHGMALLHPRVAFLTAAADRPDFFGRRLRVLAQGRYQRKQLRQELRRHDLPGAEIVCRHFPRKPAELAAELHLPSHPAHRLCCWRDRDETPRWALCRRPDEAADQP